MKRCCALAATALMLLLCAYRTVCPAEPEESGAVPPPETASVPPVETPVPSEEIAPSEEPGPSAEPSPGSPEALLAQQPIDDTHDAFLVDTGGRLGTLLVTVELGELDKELWESPIHFAVWDPADMSRPIQEMAKMTFNGFHCHEELDANFDGYMDFNYMYAMGNQPNYWFLWVWDEETGQFIEVPEYAQISSPRCNPETGIIDGWARSSGAGDGVTTFHRWEDGELVCIRRIETWWWEPEDKILTEEELTVFLYGIKVEDRIDGELTQVYYKELPPGEDFFDERAKWEHLDYHGED